jgi:hypothetical protein
MKLLLLILLLSAYCVGADEVYHGFDGVPEQRRLQLLVAAIEWRDAQLRTFSVELTEEKGSRDPKARISSFQTRNTYVIRRSDDNFYACVRMLDQKGDTLSESRATYNDAVQRNFFKARNDKIGRGGISAKEPPALRSLAFLQMLGSRVLYDEDRLSLLEWIKHAKSRGYELTVDTGDAIMPGAISLKVSRKTVSYRYLFDPKRQFLPIAAYYEHEAGGSEIHVEESREVDGLWVPVKVTRRTIIYSDRTTEGYYDYIATKFDRQRPSDDDMAVIFPPGLEVVDSIKRISYRVGKDGGTSPTPLYDSDRGVITENGNIVREINPLIEGAIKTSTPSETPSGTDRSHLGNSALWFLAASIMIVGSIVLFIAKWRHNTKRR